MAVSESAKIRHYKLLIGGKWRESRTGATFTREFPATGEIVGYYQDATQEDVEAAITAARKAFDEGPWPSMSAKEKAKVLRRAADIIRRDANLLADILVEEVGKPRREAQMEVAVAADCFDYYAGAIDHIVGETYSVQSPNGIALVMHEPVGVVGIITPFNFPLLITGWKLPAALAAGCAVVLKPSELTPGHAFELGRILMDAGLPEGVLNVISGTGAMSGAMLAESEQVDAIAFTGSTATGKAVMRSAANNLKKITLELGGKSPNIVFADADLDAVAEAVFYSIYFNCGQVCSAGSRMLVEKPIYDKLIDRIINTAKRIIVGDPRDEKTMMGPIVSQAQLRKVEDYVQSGREQGAQLLIGGERLDDGEMAKGYFFAPTVFAQVNNTMKIAQEEIFGPVLSVIPFEDADEALRIANDTMYGLKAAVWTNNLNTMFKMAKGIKAGQIMGNTYSGIGIAHLLPYGGYKQSGIGRELGMMGIKEMFMETKQVQLQLK